MFSNVKAKYPKEGTYRGRVAVELNDAFATHTPEAAYWSGWLNANTTIVRANIANERIKDFAIITTLESERDHLLACLRFLGTSDAVSKPTERGMITHKSGVLVPILEKQGIVYGKTNFTAPSWCTNSKDFWRGYIDANGEAGINKDGVLYLDIQCQESLKQALLSYIHSDEVLKANYVRADTVKPYTNGILICGHDAVNLFAYITTYVLDGETKAHVPNSKSFNHMFNDCADQFVPIQSTEDSIPLDK